MTEFRMPPTTAACERGVCDYAEVFSGVISSECLELLRFLRDQRPNEVDWDDCPHAIMEARTEMFKAEERGEM